MVHPTTGKIYVGTDSRIWEVTDQGNQANAVLLYPTNLLARQVVQAPPALDVAAGRLYFGASRGQNSTFYAINLSGGLVWSKNLGRGRFRNLPPVVDSNGKVYVAIRKSLFRLNQANGNVDWQFDSPRPFFASPIIGVNRLYIGGVDGTVFAIGCVP